LRLKAGYNGRGVRDALFVTFPGGKGHAAGREAGAGGDGKESAWSPSQNGASVVPDRVRWLDTQGARLVTQGIRK